MNTDRQPKRLLAVSAAPPVDKPTLGGNQRNLLDLLAVLRSLDFDLHVISDAHPAYAEFFDQLDALGVSRLAAPFCTDPDAAAAQLDQALRDLEPHIVHVNGHHGWLAPALVRSRELPRARRKLFTMHLPLPSVGVAAARTWKRFVPGSWAWKATRSDRAFLRLFDRALSVSRRFGDALVDSRLLSRNQVEFIPNAVDADRFQPTARPQRDRCVIGGAGNLIEQKRFDLLIEAFAEAARSPGNVELQIAGEGADQPRLERLAERLGVRENVTFLGFQRDMAAFYNNLDVFVLSSAFEAAPYVALEAAACGAACVFTDVGDIRYLFHDGVDAWVVPTGDAAALAEKIRALAGDPEARARFSAAGRQLIARDYSNDIWVRRMAELFSEEMNRAQGA